MDNTSSKELFQRNISIRQIGSLSCSDYGYTSEVKRMHFSPDGSLLVTTSEWDNTVLLWDVLEKALLKKLSFDASGISDFAFSPDGTYLAIVADTLTLWESRGERVIEDIPIPFHPIAVTFSLNGEELILTDYQGKVYFWNLMDQCMNFAFQAIPLGSRPGWPIVSRNGNWFALTSDTNEAFLWLFDSSSGDAVSLLTVEADYDEGMACSPNGNLLALLVPPVGKQKHAGIRRKEPHIQVYNIQEQRLTYDFVSPTPHIGIERSQPLAFSPDSDILVAADTDGYLYFWDLTTRQFLISFSAHSNPGDCPHYGIGAIAWNEARHCLATGGWELGEVHEPNGRFVVKLWEISRNEID